MTSRTIFGAVFAVILIAGCGGTATDSGDFAVVPGIGETRIDVPRPTPVHPQSCSTALRTDQSVTERIADLRRIGLFADRVGLSDADVAKDLEAGIAETWGGEIKDDNPYLDLVVAAQDEDRTWWRDLEADVGPGNDVYATTLKEWGAISDGDFAPTAVAETWTSGARPVKVTFELDGIAHELRPAYLEDWIDPQIATPINELILSSGRRFEFFKAFDQTAFVLALTPDERTALEARGWCFE